MQAPKYMKRQERKVLSEGGTITWGLEPNFGWLTVYSEPSGLDVTVNGTKAGRTPIERSEREPGVYRVLVTSPCHYNEGKKVKVIRGKEREVSVSLKEKQGAVRVKVEDDRGNDVAADVYIDGRKVGRAPRTFKVSVCAKELEVKHKKHGTSTKSLKILERKVTRIGVKLGEAIGDKKSIEKQMRLMKSAKNNNIKRTAIRALGRLKANEAVDDLIKILEDTSVHKIVRLNAVYALGEIGNPKAVKSLVLALYREKAYYFAQAGLALVKIGEPAVEPLVKTMFGKNNVAKSINKENVGVLAGALEANAAKVLGDIGSQSAVEPILKMAEKVDKWPEETNRLLVMARLINSLGSIGDKRALPLVYKYLEKELWDVRTICAVAINNIGDRSAVAEMLKFATTGQHPRTRAPLIEAIGNLATNEVLPQLQEMEKTQRDVTVSKSIKDSILRIKAYAQCKEDANCWIGKLVDKEAVVREKAAYELGRIGDQIAVDPLLKIINDRSENVRFAAIFAFDKLKSKKHIEAIEKLIKDEKGTRQYLVVNHNYKLLVARLKGIP
jgi:HEAT repeat protein